MTITRRDLFKTAAVAAVPGSFLLGAEPEAEPLGELEAKTEKVTPRSGVTRLRLTKLLLIHNDDFHERGMRLECYNDSQVEIETWTYSPSFCDDWMFQFLFQKFYKFQIWPNVAISDWKHSWKHESNFVPNPDQYQGGVIYLQRENWGDQWELMTQEPIFMKPGEFHVTLTCETTKNWKRLELQHPEITEIIHPRRHYRSCHGQGKS